jgi:hypothetical protein
MLLGQKRVILMHIVQAGIGNDQSSVQDPLGAANETFGPGLKQLKRFTACTPAPFHPYSGSELDHQPLRRSKIFPKSELWMSDKLVGDPPKDKRVNPHSPAGV